MSKLYFIYGVMGSSKTANLLMTKHNYEQKGMKVLLVKPSIDTRDGKTIIKSRIGLMDEAMVIEPNQDLSNLPICDAILVDEAQFLPARQVDQLHYIAMKRNIPVMCYGLLTDFQTHLFEGSKRLIEVAESVRELKTVCKCGKKASVNARLENGKIITHGEQIILGSEETYESMCYECYYDQIKKNQNGN